MKKLIVHFLLVIPFISVNGQKTGAFLAPAYAGKSPLVNELSAYKQLCQIDTNQSLIDLEGYIPHLKLDIKYATRDNFMHAKMYNSKKAYLRLPAAEALKKISLELEKKGIGILVYDAYRPYSITVKFYEMVGDSNFVASPRSGSRHNRGCAVDLSLYDLKTGEPLEMPTPFDSFTKEASANYPNLPIKALQDRSLLAGIMTKFNFHIFGNEWWHFDYKDWAKYPVLDISFEKLKQLR